MGNYWVFAWSAVMPLSGWFSDRFTAKRAFLICLILFVLGSLLCSFSQTITQLIIFRIIQGLAGGMVGPIGVIAFFMGFKYLPTRRTQQNVKLDKTGMILAPIAFASLVYSIHEGGARGCPSNGWNSLIA
ncbi:MFS transporter [Brevibacillus reuszeri]|uniref:MFS transporter n=1 Tax=Brevibacillus reuszeri TaxID=54915 RepID=UPI003D1E05F1